MTEIKGVLFDLGGVIIRLGDLTALIGDDTNLAAADFWPMWIGSEAVQAFERGQRPVDQFCSEVVEEFGLQMTPSDFGQRFAAWPLGLFAGVAELVAELPANVVTATASNTNQLHWDHAFGGFTASDGRSVHTLFDRHFPSFQLGLVKPSPDYFAAIAAELGLAVHELLFVDDNMINVEAARSVGLRSERVDGPDGARAALISHGVIKTR